MNGGIGMEAKKMSCTLQKKLVRYNYVPIGWYVVMPTCIISKNY